MVSGFLLIVAFSSFFVSGEHSRSYLAFGTVFAGLALVSRRNAFLALTTAAMLWTVNIGLLAALDPRSLFSFPRAVALVLLLRGAYFAASARSRLKRLSDVTRTSRSQLN